MKELPKGYDPKKCQTGTDDNYNYITVKAIDHHIWHDKFRIQLMENGMSAQEAMEIANEAEIELEIIYDPVGGLFAVDSDATLNYVPLVSPYSKEEVENLEFISSP